MNALAPCLCGHAAVLHKSTSEPIHNNPHKRGFDCLATTECKCRRFKLDENNPIGQLILQMEQER